MFRAGPSRAPLGAWWQRRAGAMALSEWVKRKILATHQKKKKTHAKKNAFRAVRTASHPGPQDTKAGYRRNVSAKGSHYAKNYTLIKKSDPTLPWCHASTGLVKRWPSNEEIGFTEVEDRPTAGRRHQTGGRSDSVLLNFELFDTASEFFSIRLSFFFHKLPNHAIDRRLWGSGIASYGANHLQ